MKSLKLKSVLLIAITILLFSCTRERDATGDLEQFQLTATFDNGESITFKQFDPETSDAGSLTCNCLFSGDHRPLDLVLLILQIQE